MKWVSDNVDGLKVQSQVADAGVGEDQHGKYVACLYDKAWHFVCILEYSEEHHDVKEADF